ncbi:MAG: precorrin-6A reductase [Thermoplasmata archaeon]|nr:precorrin-6A reductase [Thermoplasmata archaeon]
MKKVLIFSGTTEGRALARHLSSKGVPVTVSVATEYGAAVMEDDGVDVRVGSCGGAEGIAALIRGEGFGLVVDATHPYARTISEHIAEGCASAGVPMIRLLRAGSGTPDDVTEVGSVAEAVEFLKSKDGVVLASTGSKELHLYAGIPDYRERVVARVLSTRESIDKAMELGFEGRNLIAAQGPFTEEENLAALRKSGAAWLVTKDSGDIGGFMEKVRAARRAGVGIVLVRKPDEEGLPFDAAVRAAEDELGLEHSDAGVPAGRRSVTLIGIGMGPGDLTQRAAARLAGCDLAIGAKRMLESVDTSGMDTLEEYRADRIAEYLAEHPEYTDVACLLSGDTGFYSGAKQLLARLDRSVYDVEVECGISSMVYLASKLGETWQDACLTSSHGREANIVGLARTNAKVFTLLSGEDTVHALCRLLLDYGMDVDVAVGQDFGYPGERVVRGTPAELLEQSFGSLCVAMIFNKNPDRRNPIGIPDEDFTRGDAPMTKSEVRALSVAKLKLTDDAVVYDIGAGTGSVTIEMALTAVNGMVYAIEKETAAADLIEVNKKSFKTPNVEVVRGLAPEALRDLPPPTHAFIGGSSGNLRQIVECLLSKNPDVRIAINSVTIETMAETAQVIKDLGLVEEEIVSVSVARSKKLGGYHLMFGQNPVYIAVVRGR